MVRIFIFLLSTACVGIPIGEAKNWPQFRGPTGQGHSEAKNVPIEWSDTENVAWKAPIPGQGWSSPVLQDDRIYLTSAVSQPNGTMSLRALALDAQHGQILWDKEVFQQHPSAPRIHNKNSHASPTPVIEGGRLYVHFGHQGTACLDLSGQKIWENRSLTYEPVHGNGGSPTLVGDLLVFNCDGASNPFVAALNKSTGQVVWRTPRRTQTPRYFSFCTPLSISVKGQTQIISPASDMVAAYEPETGREIWRARYTGFSVVPRPVFGLGLVFVSSSFEQPTVLAIRPDGEGDVTSSHVEWTLSRGGPRTPSMLLIGEELYMVSDAGIAACLDARTGRFHWQERIGGNYSASPITAEGRIYFQNEEGIGVVLEAGRTFRVLAKNALGERTLASYAVTDGALFIRSAQHLFKIQKPGSKENAVP